jgi:catalase
MYVFAVLDSLPTDFFAEVEQVAFCTQNIVPGIDFSNDPLLQGRAFSYLDSRYTQSTCRASAGEPRFDR